MQNLKRTIETWLSSSCGTPFSERQERAAFLDEITSIDFKGEIYLQKPKMQPRFVKMSSLGQEILGQEIKEEKVICVTYFSGDETKILGLLNNMGYSVFQYAWKGERKQDTTMVFMTR